ncbi:hypothetical protein MJO29_011858, partial [Puccinia striiformis f. sp. tritici]
NPSCPGFAGKCGGKVSWQKCTGTRIRFDENLVTGWGLLRHKGYHNHRWPDGKKPPPLAMEKLTVKVAENPKAGALVLRIGNPNQSHTGEGSVVAIHESLGNADRLRHYRREILRKLDLAPNKAGGGVGDKFIQEMFAWDQRGLEIISASFRKGSEHFSFQTEWMRERFLARTNDGKLYSGGLLTDVTYRFFDKGYLLTTSMFCEEICRWIPIQLTWIRGLTEKYYQLHFTALFREILSVAVLKEERDNLAANVVDFSKAQRRGFILAFMDDTNFVNDGRPPDTNAGLLDEQLVVKRAKIGRPKNATNIDRNPVTTYVTYLATSIYKRSNRCWLYAALESLYAVYSPLWLQEPGGKQRDLFKLLINHFTSRSTFELTEKGSIRAILTNGSGSLFTQASKLFPAHFIEGQYASCDFFMEILLDPKTNSSKTLPTLFSVVESRQFACDLHPSHGQLADLPRGGPRTLNVLKMTKNIFEDNNIAIGNVDTLMRRWFNGGLEGHSSLQCKASEPVLPHNLPPPGPSLKIRIRVPKPPAVAPTNTPSSPSSHTQKVSAEPIGPSATHDTPAETQEHLAAIDKPANTSEGSTADVSHGKPVRLQAKPLKKSPIRAKKGILGTYPKPVELHDGATATIQHEKPAKGGSTAEEFTKGWQPAPLNSDDWDRIEANLAASRAREAEQAALLKRDRIEAKLAASRAQEGEPAATLKRPLPPTPPATQPPPVLRRGAPRLSKKK